jgi:MerR family transcriptional regulator/heat shock protein HspR
MRYVRLAEAIRRCGLSDEVIEDLLSVELLHPRPTLDAEPVIPVEEADDLRIARMLLDEMGVNVEGVEIILHMRRRQVRLQRELDELVAALKDELRTRLRDAALLGPRGLLPG